MRMLTYILLVGACLVCSSSGATSVFRVKYISADNVYLDGGSQEGLIVGDTLATQSSGNSQCKLVVAYTADYSASCTIVGSGCDFVIGQQVKLISNHETITVDTVESSVVPIDTIEATKVTDKSAVEVWSPPHKLARVTANFYTQFYAFDDQSSSNLDLSQFTGRMSLRAREILGQPLTLTVRTRGRYDQRERYYANGIPQNNWATRVWEFSLAYDDPHSPLSVQAGRISPRRAGGVGLLDGALVEYRASNLFHFGAFGGSQPNWAYSQYSLPVNRVGVYTYVNRTHENRSFWEQSLAFVGEYSKSEVNRELLVAQGRINLANGFSAFHTLELDVNRSWRLDKTNKSISVSSVYAGAHHRLNRTIRVGVNYDNRSNYWTLQSRSMVDSLFDDRLRQGVRFILDLTLPSHMRSSVSYGLRNREDDPSSTKTYSLFLSKSQLIRKTTIGSVHWSAFDGPFEKGRNYTFRLGDYVHPRVFSSIAYGGYSYTVTLEDAWRSNNWIEISSQADLGKRSSLNTSIEFDNGDDIQGLRLLFELGYSL